MTVVVAKPFKTAIQCFSVGDPIPPDACLAPFSLADLMAGGFVEEPGAKDLDVTAPPAEPEPPVAPKAGKAPRAS